MSTLHDIRSTTDTVLIQDDGFASQKAAKVAARGWQALWVELSGGWRRLWGGFEFSGGRSFVVFEGAEGFVFSVESVRRPRNRSEIKTPTL